MQFGTIHRADLLVAISVPPAIIAAALNNKLTVLLITAAAVAAIRAIFIRSVMTAYQAGERSHIDRRRGGDRRQSDRQRLAVVHDLSDRSGTRGGGFC